MQCYHNSYNWEGIAILLRNSKTLVFIEASLSLLSLLSVVTTNTGHAQPSNGTQLWTDPRSYNAIAEFPQTAIFPGILLNYDIIIILNRRFEYILIRKYIYLKSITL